MNINDLLILSQNILEDRNIIIIDNDVKDENFQAIFISTMIFFTYIVENLIETLNYFQIIGEDDYPGMNIHLVPINTDVPDNSICIYIDINIKNISDETIVLSKEFISKVRKIPELKFLYDYTVRKVNNSLKNRGFNIKEV